MIPTPAGRRRLLDVCAGTGAIVKLARDQGWTAVGSDISIDMLAKSLPRDRSVVASAHLLPFSDDSFDVATLRQGLHYLPLDRAISELERVSTVEFRLGHITMVSPRYSDWWRSFFRLVSPGRLHIFEPGDIARTCELLGYSAEVIEQIDTVGEFISSIRSLDNDTQRRVRSLLASVDEGFQKEYRVSAMEDGSVYYRQRWEFLSVSSTRR